MQTPKNTPDQRAVRPQAASQAATGPPQVFRSDDLFGRAHEIVIEHQDREYRLRITSQGKLILTA